MIIQKIADSTAPKSLVVVSTDREIRDAAAKRKAVTVRSDIFWMGLISSLETRQKPVFEPKAKRGGITEAEADLWLDYFGIDED